MKDTYDALCNKHGLLLLLLHGSQVTGKTHQESDIDIAIVRDTKKTDIDMLALQQDLSELFGSDRIDITDLTHADPLLQFAVLSKSTLLAGNLGDYQRHQLMAFHQYNDYLPFLKEEKRIVAQKLQSYVTT